MDNSKVAPETQQPQAVESAEQPQPGMQQWAPSPARPANCPPGLEYLVQMDQIMIHQRIELLEAFTGCETSNKYDVQNVMGQNIFFAKEQSNCMMKCCCGAKRPFEMQIYDNMQQEIMVISRPYQCIFQTLRVYAPAGTLIGTIGETCGCVPGFEVTDAKGTALATIEGPCCQIKCCSDIDFKVMSARGGEEIGKISKKWTGFIRESYTDADVFGVQFPKDMDVNMKATLMAAAFLIDFMFFENNQAKKDP